MKITIESTDRIVEVNGVPARIWEGRVVKEDGNVGVPVYCLVTRIAAHEQSDQREFERDLSKTKPPSDHALKAFPARMVL